MQRIAEFHSKNAKHNIYLTKAQQLRNEMTRISLEQNRNLELEDKYLTENSVPKKGPLNTLLKTLGKNVSDFSQAGSLAKAASHSALS